MSLLTDLQGDLLDAGRSLTTALRRAKVLSYNLKNKELQSWVEDELSGYSGTASAPNYRRLKVQNRGNFMNSAWRYNSQAIPLSVLPKALLEGIEEHIVYESIPSIETTIQSGENTYQVLWPPELANFLSYKVYSNLACIQAWKEIQRSQLVDILEAVRNRLLTIVLELMDQFPDLKKDNWEKRVDNQVGMIIHNNILGDRNVVATGEQVSQTVSLSVEKGNIESLVNALTQLGLSPQEAGEFREAVDDDGPRKRQDGLGPRVAQVIGKLVGRSMDWASSASAALAAQAIASYYGWK